MRFTEPEAKWKDLIPPCPIRGHYHMLEYRYSIEQDGTGDIARILECPTGRYRFLHIERVFKRYGKMTRYDRPRWGWKDE
ncbi:MAG TPA: hypothetical protein VGR71_11785 [Nitrospira sp.]|nr:hypothetical protein [Nitrospira sp.]